LGLYSLQDRIWDYTHYKIGFRTTLYKIVFRTTLYKIVFRTTYYLADMLGGFSVPQYTPLVVFRGISTTDSESYRHRPPPELKGHVVENALVKQRVSQKTPKITFSGIS
jgi:hypothetical protein